MSRFAAFGAAPRFQQPLHTAQINLPAWEKTEEAFRAVFERRFFTNHGPMLAELDKEFARFAGVKHAVCVTNGTVALMLMARSLGLKGEVIVPAFTFPATVQALVWAGFEPMLCDVDPRTHMLSAELAEPLISERTAAILGVHLWGRACAPTELEALANKWGLKLIFDACQGLGCVSNGRRFGGFGDAEAFSFHATKLINAAEGGCVTTNDDEVAARLLTMRSFSPNHEFADVHPRMNAKMSEAQATLALLSLAEAEQNIAANTLRHSAYSQGLAGLPGIEVMQYAKQDKNNHQYVVLDIDPEECPLTRDQLYTLLQAENVICRHHFHAGLHRLPPLNADFDTRRRAFPNTDRLTTRLLQLPNGQALTENQVEQVCDLVRDLIAHAPAVRKKMR